MNPHRFTIGANYENEKGPFKVLLIKGDSMLIEWDSGERITTSLALQEKILTRMEKDANAPAVQILHSIDGGFRHLWFLHRAIQ